MVPLNYVQTFFQSRIEITDKNALNSDHVIGSKYYTNLSIIQMVSGCIF